MTGRDRLRELLDAVLDEENRSLADMAHGAYSSPFHFSRRLVRDAGEPPVAMRRRVALERAAWQLARGVPVTDAAFAAGYGSVEGFARAFARAYGHPPSVQKTALPTGSTTGSAHWLPAPNGIHFHAPDGLWVEGAAGASAGEVTALMVHHDVDDVRTLVELAKGLDPAEYARERLPGLTLLQWAGPEGSIAALLNNCVGTYEIWLASVEGADHPGRIAADADPVTLQGRLDAVAPRWLAFVRDVERGAPGATGWSTRCATRPRASCSAACWRTCSPTPLSAGASHAPCCARPASWWANRRGRAGRRTRPATATPSSGCGDARRSEPTSHVTVAENGADDARDQAVGRRVGGARVPVDPVPTADVGTERGVRGAAGATGRHGGSGMSDRTGKIGHRRRLSVGSRYRSAPRGSGSARRGAGRDRTGLGCSTRAYATDGALDAADGRPHAQRSTCSSPSRWVARVIET